MNSKKKNIVDQFHYKPPSFVVNLGPCSHEAAILPSHGKISDLLNKNQIENLINQYLQTIGDIEQTLPGEDTKLDEYLCK